MDCKKSGSLICKGLHIGESDLERINMLTRREFGQEELYCFRVILCDNDIDRDIERFSDEALEELAQMFVGKTGICDHEAVSRNQQARIYEAEVEHFPGKVNAVGEPYKALVAKAYMVRTEGNRDLILEIEAGIKKEVSVGCSMARSSCSVCGRSAQECGHIPGEVYDGKFCCTILSEPTDAYEWSFVAVPAQRRAGVIKSMDKGSSKEGDAVEKLWQAQSMGRGVWLSGEEVVQLKGRMKNLMEDCEQVRMNARREVMQAVFRQGEPDERMNRELSFVLDGLSVAQMKTLRKVIRKSEAELMQPQFKVRENENNESGGSDERFMI